MTDQRTPRSCPHKALTVPGPRWRGGDAANGKGADLWEPIFPAPWGTRRDQGSLRIIENVTGAPLTGNPPITDPEQVSVAGQIPTRLSVV